MQFVTFYFLTRIDIFMAIGYIFLDKFVYDLTINSCFTRKTFRTISYKSISNPTQSPARLLPILHYGEAIDGGADNNMNVKLDCSHSHSNSNKLWCPHWCPNNARYTAYSPCWIFLIIHGFEQILCMGGILITPKANTDPLFALSSYQVNDYQFFS